jgi:hypothetical protein
MPIADQVIYNITFLKNGNSNIKKTENFLDCLSMKRIPDVEGSSLLFYSARHLLETSGKFDRILSINR